MQPENTAISMNARRQHLSAAKTASGRAPRRVRMSPIVRRREHARVSTDACTRCVGAATSALSQTQDRKRVAVIDSPLLRSARGRSKATSVRVYRNVGDLLTVEREPRVRLALPSSQKRRAAAERSPSVGRGVGSVECFTRRCEKGSNASCPSRRHSSLPQRYIAHYRGGNDCVSSQERLVKNGRS